MKIIGEHDEATVEQLKRCVEAEEGSIGVLCADGHLGYSMPIGGVVAYRRSISPSGVGYDIGCGNKAVRLNLREGDLRMQLPQIADEIQKTISFGVGRKNAERVDDPVLDSIARSPVEGQRKLIKLAQDQLGTVGSGNHYVDILSDQDGYIWIACHFGSRGLGHKTAKGFLAIAQGKSFEEQASEGEMNSPPILLPLNTPSGQDYFAAMNIALEYSYAGRDWVVERVRKILGNPTVLESVHNNHNFAVLERHFDELFCVVRKGATPAWPGQRGFIGGSMGDMSVVVSGEDSILSRHSLYSTVHGAGRVMSRRQAAGKTKLRREWRCKCGNNTQWNGSIVAPDCNKCGELMYLFRRREVVSEGKVNWLAVQEKLYADGIILRGAGPDEAPEVYRPLNKVLDAHYGTLRVLYALRPLVVVMAGENEFDPYKD